MELKKIYKVGDIIVTKEDSYLYKSGIPFTVVDVCKNSINVRKNSRSSRAKNEEYCLGIDLLNHFEVLNPKFKIGDLIEFKMGLANCIFKIEKVFTEVNQYRILVVQSNSLLSNKGDTIYIEMQMVNRLSVLHEPTKPTRKAKKVYNPTPAQRELAELFGDKIVNFDDDETQVFFSGK